MNIGIAFTYILMAGLYYGNAWESKKFPFMSQAIFVCVAFRYRWTLTDDIEHFDLQAEDGTQYNQTALLTDGKFDPVKYAQLGVRILLIFMILCDDDHNTS